MITLVGFGGLLAFLCWQMYEEHKSNKEFQRLDMLGRRIEEAERELADSIKQHEDGG